MLATEVILINLDIQTCEFILPIIDNSLILKAINSGKIKLFGTDFQGPTSLVRFNTCFIGFAGKSHFRSTLQVCQRTGHGLTL